MNVWFGNEMQAHLGRQPIVSWYYPPEVDYRLSLLPPDAKGLVVWIIEAKVRRVTNCQKRNEFLISGLEVGTWAQQN